MGRGTKREKTTKRIPKDGFRRMKRRSCHFCDEKLIWIDYKDLSTLRKYVSDRGKIRARRVTGVCVKHQREMSVAVKTARELMLLPYSQRSLADKNTGRVNERRQPYNADSDGYPDEELISKYEEPFEDDFQDSFQESDVPQGYEEFVQNVPEEN